MISFLIYSKTKYILLDKMTNNNKYKIIDVDNT